MLIELHAIKVKAHLASGNLHHQHMPAVEFAKHLVRLVVSPPGVQRYGLPCHAVEPRPRVTPAAAWQVLPVQFAVIGIEVEAQWADEIKGLHDDVTFGALRRLVTEADPCSIGSFVIFARMAYLRMHGALRRAISAGAEAKQSVAGPLRIIGQDYCPRTP